MRRCALVALLALLAALALVASGCGSAEAGGAGSGSEAADASEAPSLSDLVAASIDAASAAETVHYVLDLDVEIETSGDSGLSAFAQGPITLHVEGDASEKAFTADGSAGFAGQTFAAKLLAGEHELFLDFLGTWYGTKDMGLADGTQQGGRPPQEFLETAEARELLERVLDGDVSAGPVVDGVETWRFAGTLDGEGLADLVEEYSDEELHSPVRNQLRDLADAAAIEMLIGRGDHLLRRFDLRLALGSDALKALGGSDRSLDGLTSLSVTATLDLSRYGEPFSYEAPTEFRPFEELFGQFLGGL